MKNVILIVSVFISFLYLVVSQWLSPLIAAYLDDGPFYIVLIFSFFVTVLSVIPACVIAKEKYMLLRILLSLVIIFLPSALTTYCRFGGRYYHNGYIQIHGDLYNRFGIKILNGISKSSWFWYKGVNKYGDEVFVNIDLNEDCKYKDESEEKYDYEVRCYSLSGLFLCSKTFSQYLDIDASYDERYDPDEIKDAQYLVNKLKIGVTLLEDIGF